MLKSKSFLIKNLLLSKPFIFIPEICVWHPTIICLFYLTFTIPDPIHYSFIYYFSITNSLHPKNIHFTSTVYSWLKLTFFISWSIKILLESSFSLINNNFNFKSFIFLYFVIKLNVYIKFNYKIFLIIFYNNTSRLELCFIIKLK